MSVSVPHVEEGGQRPGNWPGVCEGRRSLGDDRSRLRGGQGLLGSQAAAGAHHGAMRVRVLQGMGLGMVQRRLGLWVLELKLGFELLMLLVHTGRPIMRKRLFALFFFLCLKKLFFYLLEQTNLFTVLQKLGWRRSLVCKRRIRLDGGELEGHLMLASMDDEVLL